MATFVTLSVGNIGGTIDGNFGTYVPAADGTISADTRDVPALLTLGATYVSKRSTTYYTNIAPGAATVGQLVASGALANGAISVTNQPDVMRQGAMKIAAGTSAITGGTVSIVYKANDGTNTTDVLPATAGASGTATSFLTKGVAHITSITVAGLVGGTSPGIQIDTTASISLPVDPGTVDLTVFKENSNTADETVGTLSTVTLGTIAPSTAPNGTHTYSFAYAYTTAEA